MTGFLRSLPELRADRGDHDDRVARAGQRAALCPVGRLVLLDLVADPLGRAGHVLACECHVSHNTTAPSRIPADRVGVRRVADVSVAAMSAIDGVSETFDPTPVGRRARLRGPDRPHLPPGEGARDGADRLRPARRAQRLPPAHRRRAAARARARAHQRATSAACCSPATVPAPSTASGRSAPAATSGSAARRATSTRPDGRDDAGARRTRSTRPSSRGSTSWSASG